MSRTLVNFPEWPSAAWRAGSEAGGWYTCLPGVPGIPWACGQLLKEERWRHTGTTRDFVSVGRASTRSHLCSFQVQLGPDTLLLSCHLLSEAYLATLF